MQRKKRKRTSDEVWRSIWARYLGLLPNATWKSIRWCIEEKREYWFKELNLKNGALWSELNGKLSKKVRHITALELGLDPKSASWARIIRRIQEDA